MCISNWFNLSFLVETKIMEIQPLFSMLLIENNLWQARATPLMRAQANTIVSFFPGFLTSGRQHQTGLHQQLEQPKTSIIEI